MYWKDILTAPKTNVETCAAWPAMLYLVQAEWWHLLLYLDQVLAAHNSQTVFTSLSYVQSNEFTKPHLYSVNTSDTAQVDLRSCRWDKKYIYWSHWIRKQISTGMTADPQREWTTKPAELLLACPMLPGWCCILWFAYISLCAFSFHWCSYGVLCCVKEEPETTEQKALEVTLKLQSSSSAVGGDAGDFTVLYMITGQFCCHRRKLFFCSQLKHSCR